MALIVCGPFLTTVKNNWVHRWFSVAALLVTAGAMANALETLTRGSVTNYHVVRHFTEPLYDVNDLADAEIWWGCVGTSIIAGVWAVAGIRALVMDRRTAAPEPPTRLDGEAGGPDS